MPSSRSAIEPQKTCGWRCGRTLSSNHVGDLDDRILVGFGKDSLSTCALDIETEDPEGRETAPLPVRSVRDEIVRPSKEKETRHWGQTSVDLADEAFGTYRQSISIWHCDVFFASVRTVYLPGWTSSQFIPTICRVPNVRESVFCARRRA